MFDPSEPTEDELLATQSVLLEELHATAKERVAAMGDSGSPRSREKKGDSLFPRLAAAGSPVRVGD